MHDRMFIYIAGPMTGIPYFNFPSFDGAKRHLEGLYGFKAEIFSPADHDRELLGKDKDWLPKDEDHDGQWKYWKMENAPGLRTMLGEDLAWIAEKGTHIYMLKGWENSQGAKAEWALAHALGLEFIYR